MDYETEIQNQILLAKRASVPNGYRCIITASTFKAGGRAIWFGFRFEPEASAQVDSVINNHDGSQSKIIKVL